MTRLIVLFAALAACSVPPRLPELPASHPASPLAPEAPRVAAPDAGPTPAAGEPAEVPTHHEHGGDG